MYSRTILIELITVAVCFLYPNRVFGENEGNISQIRASKILCLEIFLTDKLRKRLKYNI